MQSETTPKTSVVEEYLRRELEEADGPVYVKSKFIARDLEFSAKEVGAAMRQLRELDTGLEVEKWAYTGSTTWRVSASGET